MRKRRRATLIILWVIIIAVIAIVGLRLLAPRAMAPARVADPAAAKAAGEQLLASGGTTLIVVAHPDDVEWWAGGTAALLAERGRVVLVVGTSGDRGDGGLVAGLGPKREQLQREGGAVLGYSEVIFLRHPDGALAAASSYPAEVRSAITTYHPARIITFDVAKEAAGYHHVDHEAAGRVTAEVAGAMGGVTLELMHTSAPDVLVDYAPVKDKKARAFAILTSYHDLTPIVGPLSSWFGSLVGGRTISYGSKASYPEVGIEYGEVFRSVVIPAK
jgi:LmbE family N-acetylglucosaminyl deacetylase